MNKPINLDPNKYANDPLAQKLLKKQGEIVKNAIDPTIICEDYADLPDDIKAGNNVFLEGEPQTGKTMAAIKTCYDLGLPCMVVNFSKNTRPSQWLAKETLNPNKGVAGDTRELILVKGPVAICAENGYAAIINEYTTAPAESIQELLDIMDTTTDAFRLPDGSEIAKDENFVMILTSNPNCAGNFEQNDAFLTRGVHYVLDDITEKGFLAVAKRNYPWLSDRYIKTAYKLCLTTITEAKTKTAKKISDGIRQMNYLMAALEQGGNVSKEMFMRKATKAFINPLYRKGYQLEQLTNFKSNPSVQSHLNEMFNEYTTSLKLKGKPIADIAKAQAQQQASQAQTAAPEAGDDADLLSKYGFGLPR